MGTRWEESGHQGHDSVSLSPPRPDYGQRAQVHSNQKALIQCLIDADGQLRATSDGLRTWMHAKSNLGAALHEYDEVSRGLRKVISILVYRQRRLNIKFLRSERDKSIVGEDVIGGLCKTKSYLTSRFEAFQKSLDAWEALVNDGDHWQRNSYWQRCRNEAIAEVSSRREELNQFRDQIESWQLSFETWSKKYRGMKRDGCAGD